MAFPTIDVLTMADTEQGAYLRMTCGFCHQRRGKHMWATDLCPNAGWKPGNGQSQWMRASFVPSARFESMPVQPQPWTIDVRAAS